jgi:hypothetical protein
MVPADAARKHMLWLSRRGVGRRAVQAVTDLNHTTLQRIRSGEKSCIRRQTEQRILAVDCTAIGDRALVSALGAWRLIGELLDDGYTKRQIAHWLGYRSHAVQLRRDWITARNEMRVKRMYRLVRDGRLSR